MTVPSQQTFSGSPREADDHGIQVTSHSGQVIRLPTPGTPRSPQFQHSLGSALCWFPLILFPPAVVPAWPGSAARWQPRVQIRRPGDVVGSTPPRAARRRRLPSRRKCVYLAEGRPMAVDTSLCTTDRPAGGQKDIEPPFTYLRRRESTARLDSTD